MLKILIALAVLASSLGATQAQEVVQKKIHRYALVIGNKDYGGHTWRPLVSPEKDAQDMGNVLRNAGFELQDGKAHVNLTGAKLKVALAKFGLGIRTKRNEIIERRAEKREAIVAVVFFSGHGFMSADSSYLAGIDSDGKYIEEVTQNSARFHQLINDLTPEDADVETLSLILLDACRSTVSLPSLTQGSSKGGNVSGAHIFSKIGGFGRMVVFATTAGRISLDGKTPQENSVFTAALLDAAKSPSTPTNFRDYVTRVQEYTPKIARARFKVSQDVEVAMTGMPSDLFWTDAQDKEAAVKVAGLNAKGMTSSADGWIYLGDLSSQSKSWVGPRFETAAGISPPPTGLSNPSDIKLLGNMNVRGDMPLLGKRCASKKYQECERYLGTLPRGLKVQLVDIPETKNPQKWARVRFDSSALYQIAAFK
jgi:hypothetical protein